MIFLRLFWEFFKTGLFSVGGGMATVPFLEDIASKTGWFSAAQLADMIAVAESTPGPIGVNCATYVGYTVGSLQGGTGTAILGCVTATVGLITPSVIVILIIAAFLDKFRDNKYVDAAFYGLRAASVALISSAGLGILLISFFGVTDLKYVFTNAVFGVNQLKMVILFVILVVCTRCVKPLKKVHPIAFIAVSAVIGIVFRFAGA